MIRFSENAANAFRSLLQEKSLPEDTSLRLAVEKGQAEGDFTLTLVLESAGPRKNDEVESTDGMRLVVQEELSRALGDRVLEFDPEKGGFIFEATSSPPKKTQ